jgi:ABC-2 type transport system permease protein
VTELSVAQQVRLVAGREIRERGGSRSYKASTAVTLLIVLGFVLVPAFIDSDEAPEWTVAIVGEAPTGFDVALDSAASAQDAELTIDTLPAGADADEALDDGADAVLVDGEILTESEISSDLRTAISSAWAQTQVIDGLTAAGLEPEEAISALQIEPVEFATVEGEEDSEDAAAKEAAAFFGVVALFVAINSYGAWVLTGVLEEKSSRVVEVIVSAVPPRALLAGKVLGIGALGLGQLVFVAVIGLSAAIATDLTEVPMALVPAVASILVWFVLGFAFYAVGYAAAGSLVSRQEDAQSAATPLAMMVLGAYFVSLLVVGPDPDGVAAMVCSFIPFTAPLTMPARIAQDAAAPWEIAVSIASMLAGTWAMTRLAASVYERSLLQTGAPIQLWTALRQAVGAGRARDAVGAGDGREPVGR